MRILVTGGAGFIGGSIVRAALARGDEVTVLDSLRSDVYGHVSVEEVNLDPRVRFIEGDVRDTDTVAAAIQGQDLVCHQAAKVGLGVSFADAPDYVSSNALATAVLLAAMEQQNVSRLVLASSMVVYGEGAYVGANGPARPAPRTVADLEAGRFDPLDSDGGPLDPALIDEDAALDPRNVYAVSKLTQEQLAAVWAHDTGGRVAALRYHNVYGPGMPQDTPYAGVASLFRSQLEHGLAPKVFEDGLQRRDFVHVADVAAANLAAAEWTGAQHPSTVRAFNVGSGDVHTIGEVATALSREAQGPEPIVTGQFRLGDVRHVTASSARARAELGWQRRVDFVDGMREFATAPLRRAGLRGSDPSATESV